MSHNKDDERWKARSFIRGGLFVLLLLVGGLGTWSAFAKLSGAVVATGQLRVESERQVVQHPDGGVVGEIYVRESDVVEAGQVLIKLDGTTLESELAVLESQLYELIARRGRLNAEQLGRDEITFDEELLRVGETNAEVAALIEGQRQLFAARNDTMLRELEVLEERKHQLREQIKGADGEAASYSRQTDLIREELVGMERLAEQGLARTTQVMSLRREEARLQGEWGQMVAQAAQLEGQISEIEIERLRLVSGRREEAITQLRDIGYRELELKERRIALREQLSRLEIRAPRGGIVFDNTVHALKSVIRPADPILYIVPTDATLLIDAQVDPIDKDQVHLGQDAVLRFSTFNARTTPELEGTVTQISGDTFVEEQTGRSYYTADVVLKEGELAKLEGKELTPGLPVDVFIKTAEQTPIAYLAQPITDYLSRAMREVEVQ